MPSVTQMQSFGGAERRIGRLGRPPLWAELEDGLTGFDLRVKEERNTNGGAAVRKMIDERFAAVGEWRKTQTGDVDWVKCLVINGARVCIGVEIQFSARSGLLVIDVVHLREQIEAGDLDVGVIAVPADSLSVFLTDRAPSYSAAIKAVERCRATDLPLVAVGLLHDRSALALAKQRTRQGRRNSSSTWS